jgi:DNA-binding transcriptional MerR regulator
MKSINVSMFIDLSDTFIDTLRLQQSPGMAMPYIYRFGNYRIYGYSHDELRHNVINFWRDHGPALYMEKFE